MWKDFVKDYLSFTKQERRAVLVLLGMIAVVSLLPYAWPSSPKKQPDQKELQQFKEQVAALNQAVPSGKMDKGASDPTGDHYAYKPASRGTVNLLFYFDPNHLSAEGWRQLGLRDKTIQTIKHYVDKGGRFRKPEDLGKIYGLHRNELERLLPYVRITAIAGPEKGKDDRPAAHGDAKPKFFPVAAVDINAADTASFIALPGIGSKLAGRIISFREKLGGFHSVSQLRETYGLADSVFQKIKPLLACNNPSPKQININTAGADELKQHPYIRWNLANAIIKYRQQHGPFGSVEDLAAIELFTPGLLEKLKPYLTKE
jgi:competence ComEA-like helix-hairpin-helix protein